jgi:hypothetical protein
MMKHNAVAVVVAALTLPVVAKADGAPWLPVPGSTQLSIGYIDQTGDELKAGTEKMMLPTEIKQETYSISLQHGVNDSFAVDAKLNYASSSFGASDDSGRGDSVIGLNWLLIDEFERAGAPTVTLRTAAIIAGDYDTGKIDALGDGANGIELSLRAGKFLTPKLMVAGELGYRNRSDSVPDDLFVDVNVGYSVASFATLSAGYSATRSRGDLDIGDAGFSPDRFPEVREDRDLAKVGAAFAVAPHTALNVNYGEVVSGRNTTLASVWGVSVTRSF